MKDEKRGRRKRRKNHQRLEWNMRTTASQRRRMGLGGHQFSGHLQKRSLWGRCLASAGRCCGPDGFSTRGEPGPDVRGEYHRAIAQFRRGGRRRGFARGQDGRRSGRPVARRPACRRHGGHAPQPAEGVQGAQSVARATGTSARRGRGRRPIARRRDAAPGRFGAAGIRVLLSRVGRPGDRRTGRRLG